MKRSLLLGALAAAGTGIVAARPALAVDNPRCPLGPLPHPPGPKVYASYDQAELDAAYDQAQYSPLGTQQQERRVANSALVRAKLGAPLTVAYGPTDIEKVDIWRAKRAIAPVFVFVHGGAWRAGTAHDYAAFAETYVNAGITLVLPDFLPVTKTGGSLLVMADQVQRAVAWSYLNAAGYGGDPKRFYVGGHSSGGHLAGVVVTTDWSGMKVPPNFIRGAVLMSGMYDLEPVALSSRREYVNFDAKTIAELSSARHIDRLTAPIVVSHGTYEFQRQNREFVAAVQAAGKPAKLVVGTGYGHFEMEESVGSPYAPNGRAVLEMINGG
jgi:arylformamidase